MFGDCILACSVQHSIAVFIDGISCKIYNLMLILTFFLLILTLIAFLLINFSLSRSRQTTKKLVFERSNMLLSDFYSTY